MIDDNQCLGNDIVLHMLSLNYYDKGYQRRALV